MPQTAFAPARQIQPQTPPKRFAHRRWLVVLACLAGAFVLYCLIVLINAPGKQDLINVLQERSGRRVVIDKFYHSYFPPGCTAEKIQFLHRFHNEKIPLITIDKLVMLTTYFRVFTLQHRLTLVRIANMHVTVPPTKPGQPNPVMPLTYSAKSGPAIVVDKTIADGTVLDFLSKNPGEKPFRLMIDKLRIDGIGNNLPMFYRALVSSAMPPGNVESTGVFGAWNPDHPGSTPVRGTYNFKNANLAAFGGISGTLFSTGKFNGTLSHINIEGTTDVPNFTVTNTSHTRRLSAQFKAVVDATQGDTYLNDVIAHFDSTTVKCKGSVTGHEGAPGKTASLDIYEQDGRIQDLLGLFVSSKIPPMTGSVNFQGHIELPPGPQPFVERMKLTGDFGVDSGKFTNGKTESDITRLSDSAQKKKPEQDIAGSATVLSDLKGHAVSNNGVATLSHLSFSVPGAKASLNGTYNLVNYKIDFHGTLVTTGQPGDATTGFKSFFAKVLTPFYRKKNDAKIVPIKLTGTYADPNFSLDLLNKKK